MGRPTVTGSKSLWIPAVCVTGQLGLTLLPGVAVAQQPPESQSVASASLIEEVIVTARKREENLQDTPISIATFTAESLEQRQIADVSGIGQFTPNVVFDRAAAIGGSNSSAIVYIRGIGQDAAISTIDLGVGTYVDGVYLARSVGGVLDLIDIERIEVLRGPQGTLFGRNTIGGAISITSKKPGRSFGSDLSVSVGNDSQANALMTVWGPLTDSLSGKISLLSKNRDGYVERADGTDFGDENLLGGRVALRWIATDNIELDFALDATTKDENGAPFALLDVVSTAAFPTFHNAFVAPPAAGCFDFGTGMSTGSTNPACFNAQWALPRSDDVDFGTFAAQDDLDVLGTSLSAEWSINDSLTLKSITAFRKTESSFAIDQDHSPHTIAHVATTADQDQQSQELQLLGRALDKRLNWIVGLYYFQEDGASFEQVTFAPVSFRSGGNFDNDSFAAFAQGTFDVTTRLSITAGARFTQDTKRFQPDQYVISNNNALVPPFLLGQPGGPPAMPPPGFPILPPDEAELKVSETTPLVTLAYSWAEDLMTYVSYSEGFKSGGFVQRIFPPEPAVRSFDPEYVDAYEVGIKWTGLGQRLRVNAAAFFMDYTDLQFVVQSDSVAPLVLNQTAAKIRGFELELFGKPTANLSVELGVGYINDEYTEIDADVPASLNITTSSQLVKTPEWSANGAIAYTIAHESGATFTPRIDLIRRSEYFNNSINSPQIAQDAYSQWDMGITYKSGDDKWTVAAIGKNLSDERVLSAGFSDTRFLGTSEGVLSRGREWALTVKRSF
jgi:iron complex outermembrane receptor protein